MLGFLCEAGGQKGSGYARLYITANTKYFKTYWTHGTSTLSEVAIAGIRIKIACGFEFCRSQNKVGCELNVWFPIPYTLSTIYETILISL